MCKWCRNVSFGRRKHFIFVNRVIESYYRPIMAKERKIWLEWSSPLITCPAGSDWSPVVTSIFLCCLPKFSWFAFWSRWWWLVRYFLVGPCKTQGLCSYFFWFQIYVVSIHFSYRIVLLFLRLFQQFYFLNWLISCWYLSSAAMLVFELFLDGIFPYLRVRIVRLSERSFSWVYIWFYNCWGWFCLFLKMDFL